MDAEQLFGAFGEADGRALFLLLDVALLRFCDGVEVGLTLQDAAAGCGKAEIDEDRFIVICCVEGVQIG